MTSSEQYPAIDKRMEPKMNLSNRSLLNKTLPTVHSRWSPPPS